MNEFQRLYNEYYAKFSNDGVTFGNASPNYFPDEEKSRTRKKIIGGQTQLINEYKLFGYCREFIAMDLEPQTAVQNLIDHLFPCDEEESDETRIEIKKNWPDQTAYENVLAEMIYCHDQKNDLHELIKSNSRSKDYRLLQQYLELNDDASNHQLAITDYCKKNMKLFLENLRNALASEPPLFSIFSLLKPRADNLLLLLGAIALANHIELKIYLQSGKATSYTPTKINKKIILLYSNDYISILIPEKNSELCLKYSAKEAASFELAQQCGKIEKPVQACVNNNMILPYDKHEKKAKSAIIINNSTPLCNQRTLDEIFLYVNNVPAFQNIFRDYIAGDIQNVRFSRCMRNDYNIPRARIFERNGVVQHYNEYFLKDDGLCGLYGLGLDAKGALQKVIDCLNGEKNDIRDKVEKIVLSEMQTCFLQRDGVNALGRRFDFDDNYNTAFEEAINDYNIIKEYCLKVMPDYLKTYKNSIESGKSLWFLLVPYVGIGNSLIEAIALLHHISLQIYCDLEPGKYRKLGLIYSSMLPDARQIVKLMHRGLHFNLLVSSKDNHANTYAYIQEMIFFDDTSKSIHYAKKPIQANNNNTSYKNTIDLTKPTYPKNSNIQRNSQGVDSKQPFPEHKLEKIVISKNTFFLKGDIKVNLFVNFSKNNKTAPNNSQQYSKLLSTTKNRNARPETNENPPKRQKIELKKLRHQLGEDSILFAFATGIRIQAVNFLSQPIPVWSDEINYISVGAVNLKNWAAAIRHELIEVIKKDDSWKNLIYQKFYDSIYSELKKDKKIELNPFPNAYEILLTIDPNFQKYSPGYKKETIIDGTEREQEEQHLINAMKASISTANAENGISAYTPLYVAPAELNKKTINFLQEIRNWDIANEKFTYLITEQMDKFFKSVKQPSDERKIRYTLLVLKETMTNLNNVEKSAFLPVFNNWVFEKIGNCLRINENFTETFFNHLFDKLVKAYRDSGLSTPEESEPLRFYIRYKLNYKNKNQPSSLWDKILIQLLELKRNEDAKIAYTELAILANHYGLNLTVSEFKMEPFVSSSKNNKLSMVLHKNGHSVFSVTISEYPSEVSALTISNPKNARMPDERGGISFRF